MTCHDTSSLFVCPGCQAFFVWRIQHTLYLGGFKDWSDGMPSSGHQPLARCSACAALFWLADAEPAPVMPEEPERPIGRLPRAWLRWRGDPDGRLREEAEWLAAVAAREHARPIGQASFADVLYVLEHSEGVGRDLVLWLRKRIWWEWNNRYRGGRGIVLPRPPNAKERANMEAMLDLLRDGNGEPDELVLQGELLRLLGRFDEAIAVLQSLPAGRQSDRAAIIEQLARQRDRQVRLLNP